MFEDEIFEENLSKVDEFYIEIDLPGIELN